MDKRDAQQHADHAFQRKSHDHRDGGLAITIGSFQVRTFGWKLTGRGGQEAHC
jgi:hypothetical protein